MHLYELFACRALILVHLCVLLCILFYRFVASIKNLDLDSEYVNVGLVNRRFTSKNSELAHLNFGRRRSRTIPHSRLERPRLVDRKEAERVASFRDLGGLGGGGGGEI